MVCESPQRLRGSEHVAGASICKVVSSKRVTHQAFITVTGVMMVKSQLFCSAQSQTASQLQFLFKIFYRLYSLTWTAARHIWHFLVQIFIHNNKIIEVGEHTDSEADPDTVKMQLPHKRVIKPTLREKKK